MVYRTIGVICSEPSSGINMSFVEFQENAGAWSYDSRCSIHLEYTDKWKKNLENITGFSAADYHFASFDFGKFIGQEINKFIEANNISYQVALVTCLGFPAFYQPGKMIAQLGSGAAIAAEISLPVITELPAMDVALGGNGRFFNEMAGKLNLESDGDAAKNALLVALAGVLRWREEYNFTSSKTGSLRNSIGGAVWLGQEA